MRRWWWWRLGRQAGRSRARQSRRRRRRRGWRRGVLEKNREIQDRSRDGPPLFAAGRARLDPGLRRPRPGVDPARPARREEAPLERREGVGRGAQDVEPLGGTVGVLLEHLPAKGVLLAGQDGRQALDT